MTDKEILEIDFYDICGIDSVFMTDEMKIRRYREIVERKKYDDNGNMIPKINKE